MSEAPGILSRGLAVFDGSPGTTLQDPVHASSTDPGIRPLRAAYACTYAKTPASAFPLVTGSLGTSYRVPPAGFEPAHTAPEAVALSPELRGRVGRGRCCSRRRVEHYQLSRGGHERVFVVVPHPSTSLASPTSKHIHPAHIHALLRGHATLPLRRRPSSAPDRSPAGRPSSVHAPPRGTPGAFLRSAGPRHPQPPPTGRPPAPRRPSRPTHTPGVNRSHPAHPAWGGSGENADAVAGPDLLSSCA